MHIFMLCFIELHEGTMFKRIATEMGKTHFQSVFSVLVFLFFIELGGNSNPGPYISRKGAVDAPCFGQRRPNRPVSPEGAVW